MTSVTKIEHSREGSSSSIASTPELADPDTIAHGNAQTQKRKGGRKPIYATSEERKQRNRQAQAAFRERRTEYIKQLETTIKHHEETLQNLQQSHRSAADECLMLRYKNSLLERILLEKGIDVQAELHAKTGSPHLGPTHAPQGPVSQPPPIQRAIMNRHHQARRSTAGIAPKMELGNANPQTPREGPFSSHSPQLQPTPPSHTSSPTTVTSPGYSAPGGMSPSGSELLSQPRSQPHRALNPTQIPIQAVAPRLSAPRGLEPSRNEQEYDAQADMVDDDPSDASSGPGPYPHIMQQQQQQQQQQQIPPGAAHPMARPGQQQPVPRSTPQQQSANSSDGNGPVFGAMTQLFDPYDQTFDADPFGLSASMHLPTHFSFETSSMR
ncbi:MAG: hypothetical protein M1819_003865 [Sarea resinae]|nr:MAG: hypothetical protein M1819_003865 [Sarea resinae]